MPAVRDGLFRLALAAAIGLSWAYPAAADDWFYTDEQADCAARMIFMNECSGKEENLIFWSPDEAFPSLGIGHFIWYPEGAAGPYRESFPGFLEFAEETGIVLPDSIAGLPGRRAPWKTREEYLADRGSARMEELHALLRNTKRQQAHYMLRRFRKVFPTILDDLSDTEKESVQRKYDLLMKSAKAAFAMIDYVNFKGEGLRTDARYDGTGWGLAQVLLEMEIPDDPERALDEFILAAERVLETRVRLSPRLAVEAKWLPGWKNRLRGYKNIVCD